MKKIFTFISALFACISMNAATLNLTLEDLNNGWSSSYDAATQTITFEGGWGHRGWSLNADYSSYNYFVMEISEATTDGAVYIYYGDGSESNHAFTTSSKYVIGELSDQKSSISAIDVVSYSAGTVTIASAYFDDSTENPLVELDPLVELSLSNFGTTDTDGTLTISDTGWGWHQWWCDPYNLSDYDAIGFTLAEAVDFPVGLEVYYTNDTDGSQMQTVLIEAGQTEAMQELNSDLKNAVQKLVFRQQRDDELNTVTLKSIYVRRTGATYTPSTSTGITSIAAATQQTTGKIYNLQGQQVKTAQKGIYIINGKKVVVK